MLLPAIQLVDSGYLDAPQIVAAREEYAVALRGPARPDCQWQTRKGTGFALDNFQLDWEREQPTCPTGRPPIRGKVLSKDCGPCPSRPAYCRA